jgi:hypothetical protein
MILPSTDFDALPMPLESTTISTLEADPSSLGLRGEGNNIDLLKLKRLVTASFPPSPAGRRVGLAKGLERLGEADVMAEVAATAG